MEGEVAETKGAASGSLCGAVDVLRSMRMTEKQASMSRSSWSHFGDVLSSLRGVVGCYADCKGNSLLLECWERSRASLSNAGKFGIDRAGNLSHGGKRKALTRAERPGD